VKVYKKWIVVGFSAILLMAVTIVLQQKASNVGDLHKKTVFPVPDRVQTLAYDDESKMLYVGSYQNRVDCWFPSGEKKWSFDTDNVVCDLSLESGNALFVASDDQHVYVLDKTTGVLKKDFFIQRRVYDINIDSTGSYLAVSAGTTPTKHYIYLYSLKTDSLLWKVPTQATCYSVKFSNDDERIYVGSNRSEILALDIEGNEIYRTKLNSEVRGISLNPDSQDITVATEYGILYRLGPDGTITDSRKFDFVETLTGFGHDGVSGVIALGGKQGEFYVLSKNWDVVFSSRLPVAISAFAFTKDDLLVGSLGEPVYSIPYGTFTFSRFAAHITYWFKYLVVLFILLLIVSIFHSFEPLLRWICKLGFDLKKHRTAYLLLLPTFMMLFLFMYLPIGEAFTRAFTDWNIRSDKINFIGFENFRKMVTEGYFLIGLKNLLVFGIADMLKVVTVPLLVAELVFALKSAQARYWFRFLFVLPLVIPMIVTILMWKNIYDPTIGLLNQLLGALDLGRLQKVWLGDPKTAIGAIIGINFPWIDGFAFLIYYGGLINIPSQLFEAAKVDGAGRWWNFTRIHIPLLSPQFKILIILKFIGAIQNFMPIYILTGGGPGTETYVPGLELYYHATTFGNYGYACALGMAMFVFIFIGTFFNMKIRTQSQN
jgi:ABC-type sugar transport system permease subunit/outer membrane protein assembly factor BamB